MNVQAITNAVRSQLKVNSPVILSAVAAVGTLSTAYLSARASFQASDAIMRHESQHGYISDRNERLKERTKLVWRFYIPAAASAVTTVVCIIGSNRIEAKKTIAAQTAFAFSERSFSEYRDKVVEQFGEHKDRAIRDKVAEEAVLKNPPSPLLISGPGNVLCCELYTGRYFTSDIETIRKAANQLNERLLKRDYMTLDDWYHMIGLRQTSHSGQIGWTSDKLLELSWTTTMTEDERPCLVFEYNYVKPI